MTSAIKSAVSQTFMGEHPLTRGSRPLWVVAAWMAFHLLQAATLAATDPQPDRIKALFLLYGAIGASWATLTFFVGVRLLPEADERPGPTFLRHAIGLLICGLLDALVRRIVSTMLGSTPAIPWYGTLLYFADRTAVGYLAIVLLTRTLAAHDRFIARQQQSLSLQAELARARLAALEEQLHPHFLFNCLGAVSELAHEAPASAARMLRQLASVLRFAVERRGTEVTVAEELAALEPYLEVQRTRFSDWLNVETRVEPGAANLLMPPLVLQPLVENAIRHGLVRRDSAGMILVSAAVRDDALILEVRDNGVGLRGDHLTGRGIGTGNVRERLATLYGDQGRLMVFEDALGGVVSQVSLPAHQPPPHNADAPARDGEGFIAKAFRRWPVASVAIAWAVWGLLWTQQSVAYLAFRGRLAERSVGELFAQDFLLTMLWAALTPLMLLMARIVPLDRRAVAARAIAHVVAAIAIASLHEWAGRRLLTASGVSLNAEWIASTAWGMLAYAVVLAAAHNGRIRGWLRERDLADARLRVSIAESDLQASYDRARPLQLLDRLESIAQSIQDDAATAERLLARLGDQLRASLEQRVPA